MPRIGQLNGKQIAPLELIVEMHVRAARTRAQANRHMFIIGLECRGPTLANLIRRHVVLIIETRIVVHDLMIVPDHEPRHAAMGFLQGRVELVLRVNAAIIAQRERFDFGLTADLRSPTRLVNIVAHMQDELRIHLQQIIIGVEKALLIMLTGDDPEFGSIHGG